MISKAKIKLIQSLKHKKNRDKNGLFVAEGIKTIKELLDTKLSAVEIFCTQKALSQIEINKDVKLTEAGKEEIKKVTHLSTPSEIVGLFKTPENDLADSFRTNFILVLDGVQDPGNLGTIIRLADWYDIKNIVCSENCVDAYNPKVVQSTMGSIFRVKVHYTNLLPFLEQANRNKFTIYGSFMNGETIYTELFDEKKILIMGSEGKGISDEVEKFVEKKIGIPTFFNGDDGPESLNVAIASAIIVSEMQQQ
ncbi:MAG: RNA methyltransferase [Bacteroidetes bacterium]|nr:MAG: RNA methyltransferase [Bacteroidota bacterium]